MIGKSMSETQQAATQPTQIGIGAQYVKDLSFESPNAPQVFSIPNSQPEINIGVNVASRNLDASAHEVLLALKLEAKLAGKTAYIVELAYAGVFVLPKMPDDQTKMFLMVEAPRLLFPFARAIVADAVRDGGFAPMMLSPIDFMALYQANKGTVGLMPTQGAA
jgi:preprotein translocase subunit SecB